MQETIITFETAKLSKEKGFDLIVRNAYHYNGSNCIEITTKNSENIGISAPSQSLLQKWLRDVHNIEIAVQWFDNCYIKAVAKKPFKANTYRVEGIDTYEEALELGLQEALKLIK